MYGQLNRIRDVEHLHLDGNGDNLNVMHIEALSPLMFWSITLLLKRHLFTYTPSEILYPAEVIVDILLNQSLSPNPLLSPFHLHFLALSVITLLEVSDIPELSNDAWESLEKALQIVSHRETHIATAGEFENIFTTPSWDTAIRSFIERKLAKSRSGQQATPQGQNLGVSATAATVGGPAPPLVGPTEQRSLQHLADLAVGAGGGAANAASPPATANVTGDGDGSATVNPPAPGAADGASSATTEAKQQPRVLIDFTRLTKKGYLNVFAGI
jgi:hypothetical protein